MWASVATEICHTRYNRLPEETISRNCKSQYLDNSFGIKLVFMTPIYLDKLGDVSAFLPSVGRGRNKASLDYARLSSIDRSRNDIELDISNCRRMTIVRSSGSQSSSLQQQVRGLELMKVRDSKTDEQIAWILYGEYS